VAKRSLERIFVLKFLLTTSISFLLLAACFSTAPAQAQNDSASFSIAPYKVGEKLTYTVSFSSFTAAASVEMQVAGRGAYFGREGIELRANVQTNGAINAALLDINNDYTTYIDPETGRPYRTQQVIREGGRVEDVSREYNQPAGISAIPPRKNEVVGDYDLLSALYRIRALPLTQGSSYRFTARHDSIQYDTEIRVTGKQIIKTHVGSFNAIVTQVRISNNKEADSYRIRIYFSDDERHVPILIIARHSAGEIRAEIASSEMPTEQPQPKVNQTTITATNQSKQQTPNNTSTANSQNAPTGPQSTNIPGITLNPIPGNPNTPQTPTNPQGPQNPTIVTPQPTGSNNPNAPLANKQPASKTATALLPKPFPADVPFTANEQLNFNVYWQNSVQPVGKVSFQISQRNFLNGRDSLMLTAKVDSAASAVAKLFNLNDAFTSYIDPETLLPYQTEIKLQQPNSRHNQTLTLEQERGIAVIDKNKRIEIPVGTHDVLSLAYALRLFDLTPEKQTPVSLLIGNRTFVLTVKSLHRESIEIGGQTIKAVQLQLTIDEQSPDKFSLRLWISDDRRRLPLRFTAKLSQGSLRADLIIALNK
jgi:hypothetical protein